MLQHPRSFTSIGSTGSLECNRAKEDTLGLASSEVINKFSLKKNRVTCNYDSVVIEQTDIIVEGHAKPFWRSISVEGDLRAIERFLHKEVVDKHHAHRRRELPLQTCLVESSLNGTACGYPEFVVYLYRAC